MSSASNSSKHSDRRHSGFRRSCRRRSCLRFARKRVFTWEVTLALACLLQRIVNESAQACSPCFVRRMRVCDRVVAKTQSFVRARATLTAGYLSFGPMAQCVVHALKGLACRARFTPASLPASHCKQCSALTSPSLHARGCASPSRARCGKTSIIYFSVGPKLRYTPIKISQHAKAQGDREREGWRMHCYWLL